MSTRNIALQLIGSAAGLVCVASAAFAEPAEAAARQMEVPSAEVVKQTVAEVLSSDEYVFDGAQRRRENWVARLAAWLSRALGSDRLANVSPVVFWVVLAACLLGLALIFYHVYAILRRALRGGRGDARTRQPDRLEEPEGKDPAVLRGLAAEQAAKGEYRTAFRHLYVAILLTLDGRGLMRYAAEKTNWEYVREAAGSPIEADLRALTAAFDRKWYGSEEWRSGEYERCIALAESVTAEGAR